MTKLTGRGGPGRGQGRIAKPEKAYKAIPLKLPPDVIEWLRENVDNRNGFIVEAIREKISKGKAE